jgi:hypothetical protein
MWKEGLTFKDAFHQVKAIRGVANPNAGFICRLLALQKDLHPDGPPSPARLYRMAPDVGEPSAKAVEQPALSADDLDPRTSFVAHGGAGLFVWHGARGHAAYREAARTWAAQLVKFEAAAAPVELEQGSEDEAFWSLLNGRAPVAPRLPKYDSDYGVGKSPSLPPPETLVSLPADQPASGSKPSGPAFLQPGVHTTAAADFALPTMPPQTPRGAPDEPLATPRGRGAPDEPSSPAGRSAKKPRDGAMEEPVEEDDDDEGEPYAELYSFPEWEFLSMFDRDDLLDEGVFALLCYRRDRKTPEHVMLWVGGESDWTGERDADIMPLIHEFVEAKGLPELPGTIVHQTEEEDGFWDYFVNG